ncbi:MAG: hypothetical protein WBB95_17190 [Pseudomonas sp.]|uniref:hypothetical protein n=1 Tax=Pseudomonas sp. TaxID=306 RepID=UPI003C75841E
MELTLEAVALFALKLVHETEGASPILRDDLVMDGYEREVFGLLVRQGDLTGVQVKLDECIAQALNALGGTSTVLGRELHKLSADVQQVRSVDQLSVPLITLLDYLKDIQ